MILGESPRLLRAHGPLGFAERLKAYTPVATGDAVTITAESDLDTITAAITTAEDRLSADYEAATVDGRVPTAAETDALNDIAADLTALYGVRDTAVSAADERTAAAAAALGTIRRPAEDADADEDALPDESDEADADGTDIEADAGDDGADIEAGVDPMDTPADAPAPTAAREPAPAGLAKRTEPGRPASGGTRASRKTSFAGRGTPAAPDAIRNAGALPTGQKLLTVNSLASATWGRRDSEYDNTFAAAQLFHDIHPGKVTRARGGARDEVFAQIATTHEFEVTPNMTPQQVAAVVERATDIYSAPNRPQGLTAALGWCAPPERLWNLLPVALRGSYINTPVITSVGRGGLEFPVEPDLPTALDNLYADPTDYGFYYTEAQEIARATAGTPKPCLTIPCPGWDAVQWDIDGICITSDVLQDRAWPEFVQWWIDLTLALHEKKRGMWKLAQILAGSENGGTFAPGFGLGSYDIILSAIELIASDIRERYGVADEANSFPVEFGLPLRAREFIRQDLRRRRGTDLGSITNGEIDRFFSELNIRVQYLSDWQVRNPAAGAITLGGASRALRWPTQMDILVWLPGTWTEVRENIVNLGRTVTPELARQNQALRLFTEDARAVFRRGGGSWTYTLPLAYAGKVGPEEEIGLGGDAVAATAPTLAGASAWTSIVPLPGGVTGTDPETP